MSEAQRAVNRRMNRGSVRPPAGGWDWVDGVAEARLTDAEAETISGTRFVTKDSGKREERPSGYVRDTQEGKPRFDLMFARGLPADAQFMTRVAQLLARGAQKYNERNWEKANDQVDLDRFQSSAIRHLVQWMTGDREEDHAAAVVFNLLAHETTLWKMENQ